jgi:hypothetical protein
MEIQRAEERSGKPVQRTTRAQRAVHMWRCGEAERSKRNNVQHIVQGQRGRARTKGEFAQLGKTTRADLLFSRLPAALSSTHTYSNAHFGERCWMQSMRACREVAQKGGGGVGASKCTQPPPSPSPQRNSLLLACGERLDEPSEQRSEKLSN